MTLDRIGITLFPMTNTNTTIETITRKQIRALREEAREHRDHAMVDQCDLALDGNSAAIAVCVQAINYAEAQ